MGDKSTITYPQNIIVPAEMVEGAIKDAAAKLAEIDAKPEKKTNWWDEPPPKPAVTLPRAPPSWASLYGRHRADNVDFNGDDEYDMFKFRRLPPPLTLDQLQARLTLLQTQVNRLQESHSLLDKIAGGWMAEVKNQFKLLEDDIIGVDANHGQIIYDILARLERLDGVLDSRADNLYRTNMPPPANPAPAPVPAPMPAPMPAPVPSSKPAPMHTPTPAPMPAPVPSSKPPLPPSTPIPLPESISVPASAPAPENVNLGVWPQIPPTTNSQKVSWFGGNWPF